MDAGRMDLAEIELIRRLKYRYLRCVDLKLWDEIADVFAPDATADYGTPSAGRPLNLGSRDEIVAFLRDSLGNGIITLHSAGPPASPSMSISGCPAECSVMMLLPRLSRRKATISSRLPRFSGRPADGVP